MLVHRYLIRRHICFGICYVHCMMLPWIPVWVNSNMLHRQIMIIKSWSDNMKLYENLNNFLFWSKNSCFLWNDCLMKYFLSSNKNSDLSASDEFSEQHHRALNILRQSQQNQQVLPNILPPQNGKIISFILIFLFIIHLIHFFASSTVARKP